MEQGESNKERSNCCGIIMPISTFGSYTKDFWESILGFLKDAIRAADMNPIVAWEDERTDVIHAKILENIATMPVMIGVIMGGNPNVMLECGMRIWSNKPILLIKGEEENPPFDVSPIQCLSLAVDCNYFRMLELKTEIVKKLKYLLSDEYKTFKSYFNVPESVEVQKTGGKTNFPELLRDIRQEITLLRSDVGGLRRRVEWSDRFELRHRGTYMRGLRSETGFGAIGASDSSCTTPSATGNSEG